MQVSIEKGVLYVVATPIGNLGDLSSRAREVLAGVDHIAAEDTRHSRGLLAHFDIHTSLSSLHEHNETREGPRLVERLLAGDALALISDAGTPLISDPGYRLVRLARDRGVRIVPVPGPSALTCALSACGLPADRFVFEGFLPPRATARRARLAQLCAESRTLVFYEASHRIEPTLSDMAGALGTERPAVVARELTKRFETLRAGGLEELARWIAADPQQHKGEFVVLVAGASPIPDAPDLAEARRVLGLLLEELPVKQAVALAAGITGQPKNQLYALALELRDGLR
ncbi:MAG: 16S rRNA (cytidine(1402)-2'-O)-methyltransferase [Gammaproteobacteria bacterium]|nr:16S rRNA (cytidine(1402)-2'-O)-methyltransferase [Gammaproteobacteria bacterium]